MSDLAHYRACAIALPDNEKNGNISEETTIGAVGGIFGATAVHAVIVKLSQLWESGAVIDYSYLGGTVNQKYKVDQVILEWFPYANISFQRAETGTLRISFDPQLGSWSYVGKVTQSIAAPAATMNFGWIEDDTVISDQDRGVILHEFGHVLGLLHEHQGAAREGAIQLDEKAAYSYYNHCQRWDPATIKSHILDTYNGRDVSNYGELDSTSIMKYFMPAAMNQQHIDVPANHALSDKDEAYMIINYPRPTPHELAPTWTLDYALEVSGVDTATAQKIKDAKGNVNTMRELFTNAQVTARMGRSDPAVQVGKPLSLPAPAPSPNPAPNPARTGGWCTERTPSSLRGVLSPALKLWMPYRTLTYGFMDDDTVATSYRKTRVRTALAFYMSHVSVVFREVPMPANLNTVAARDECTIRISLGPVVLVPGVGPLAGWSWTGTDALTEVHLSTEGFPGRAWTTSYIGGLPLNEADELTFSAHDRENATGTLYHEIGHILGLMHEADSPHTRIRGGGVFPVLTASAFDPASIMLYEGLDYDDRDAQTPLISTPSPTDLDLLRLFYPDNGNPNGAFDKALKNFAFTPTDRDAMLASARAAIVDSTHVNAGLVAQLWTALAGNLNTTPRLSNPELSAALRGVGDGPVAPFFNPGGNQIFTLQFPGRFLDEGSYAWDTSMAGTYGQFIKPVAVNEADFRLVDQLYDLAPVVSGPNGVNLSIVYEQVLNNLLPKYVPNGLAQQQDEIRQWLMKDVPMSAWIKDIMARQMARENKLASDVAFGMTGVRPGSVSVVAPLSTVTAPGSSKASKLFPGAMFDVSSKDEGDKLNPIELSELLMNEYLYAKQDWEVERDALIRQASQADLGTPESKKALNELTRKLAHITATRQAQLAAKYSDAVVRGYSHTVRDYMGYLDIASPAEALQNAKDSLREAAMSSLDRALASRNEIVAAAKIQFVKIEVLRIILHGRPRWQTWVIWRRLHKRTGRMQFLVDEGRRSCDKEHARSGRTKGRNETKPTLEVLVLGGA
ncbi:hypothetical protein C8R46DRAFT_1252910 [Mycena filopes]|nr:hypothetical protein C8R46DRAFT_1252910 [Mycena filopes]